MTNSPGGPERRRMAQGAQSDRLQEILADLDPEVAEWADDFVFGAVWGRAGLSHEERMLVAISALATRGEVALLGNYLRGAVESGVDPRKIHETIVMLVVYAGFPPTVRALVAWRKVFAQAVADGVVPADSLASVDGG